MDPDRRFWERIARRYAASPIRDRATWEAKLARTRAHLAPEARVLELGCGTGGAALAHAPHVASVRATDVSAAMIAIGRQRAGEAGVSNVAFEIAPAADLDVAPSSLDAVLALNVLHLLPDWRETVARAARWLRPGGVLVTSTAVLADDLPWLRAVLPPMRWVGLAPPTVLFLGAGALRAAHAEAGLEIVEDWKPVPRAALFLIARRPAEA